MSPFLGLVFPIVLLLMGAVTVHIVRVRRRRFEDRERERFIEGLRREGRDSAGDLVERASEPGPEPVIRVGTARGDVVLHVTVPREQMAFDPQSARLLADRIRTCADRAEGAQPPEPERRTAWYRSTHED